QPCASEEDTRAPSRITESFQVELSWLPPPQIAEDVIREFGDLLMRVEIDHDGAYLDDSAHLYALVRDLGLPGAPLPGGGPIWRWAARAWERMGRALAIWATEVCPRRHPPPEPGADDCILLACIHFDLDASGNLRFNVDPQGHLLPGSVDVDDCTRPV